MKLFDVIVPTFERYNQLPEFFSRNAALEYANANVWIIDDHSSQCDPSVIPRWQNLTYIRNDENRGQAFSRNVAIAKGNAPYIISLDDDAWFIDVNHALTTIVMTFEEYKDAGCLMFNVATPNSKYSVSERGLILPLHVTCGCAYKREVLSMVGNFSGFLHSGAEESDLSIRIYQAGFVIRFASDVRVFHSFNPEIRTKKWHLNVRHNTTRNDLLIVLMRYPVIYVLPYILGKYLSHLRFALENKTHTFPIILATVRAFFGFVRLAPLAIRHRKALSIDQFRFWRSIK